MIKDFAGRGKRRRRMGRRKRILLRRGKRLGIGYVEVEPWRVFRIIVLCMVWGGCAGRVGLDNRWKECVRLR